MKTKKSNIRVYTGFVSPLTFKEFTKNDLLPIICIRNISSSSVIGHLSGTPVHFKELAPSSELFRKKRDKLITIDEFKKLYAIEISEVDIPEIVGKFDLLVQMSGAKGIVLLGYGSKKDECHRSVLADILNNSGLLEDPIKELIV